MHMYDLIMKLQRNIPPQIERQQPVLFEDAHGRVAPFHIEFINCREAFEAVIEVRFRHVPGLRKFKAGEYVMQESHTNREINLAAPWDSVFLPGRKVNMSMVFKKTKIPHSICPGCHSDHDGHNDSGIECPNCGLWYQRIVELPTLAPRVTIRPGKRKRPSSSDHGNRQGANAVDDEIQQFKRVRVIEPEHAQGNTVDQECSDTDMGESYYIPQHARGQIGLILGEGNDEISTCNKAREAGGIKKGKATGRTRRPRAKKPELEPSDGGEEVGELSESEKEEFFNHVTIKPL
ncbi:hypothetical protein FGG08_001151 [Glutinoglossum americanum]|uniref:Ubiquitin-like domain-containing protein n=1 Tax=Glutinoglossum americanum TaxID=1670608 RepID=A0A9P8L5L9_9PEZI|nr:hypothetical protein FGG08_001151 [Glutinoglossum americanum]